MDDLIYEALGPTRFRFTNNTDDRMVMVSVLEVGNTKVVVDDHAPGDPQSLKSPLEPGESFTVTVTGGPAVLHAKIPGKRDIEGHLVGA